MVLSPKRRVLECHQYFYPFGNTPAHNALEGLEMSAKPADYTALFNRVLNVLFLGCGDLRNPLTTSVGGGIIKHQVDQHIHINDASLPVIARNVLILKIISCQEFDPNNHDDMDYVWDIWYNTTFSRSTTKRFTIDVKSLLDEPLPSNMIIPKSSYLKELKAIWIEWISKAKSASVEHVLAERADFITKCWAALTLWQNKGLMESSLVDTGSFSVAVDQATKRLEQYLVNDMTSKGSQNHAKLVEEAKQYFKSGVCGSSKSAATNINPTFLQPITGKWLVHYSSCPFEGYLPIPLRILNVKDDQQNKPVLFQYCKSELQKLLGAFRRRMESIKFYFHPCDAFVLCFDDSLPKFDLIDTSNLADHVGLVNLLTAGARKLRSDQSVLLTESLLWSNVGSSEAHYLQEVLCCPMSLIPTLYGLRLMDNVELGPETLRPMRTLSVSVSRLHWKRSLPFVGVQLSLSSALDQSLKILRAKCFSTANPSGQNKVSKIESIIEICSPLTFQYVLSDLIHRGGHPSSLIEPSFLGLPPVFRKTIETNRAWMEQRPVWRVKVFIPFTPMEQTIYDQIKNYRTSMLRLILIPITDFLSCVLRDASPCDLFLDLKSTENHFVDNIEVHLKLKSSGLIDEAEISFLLEDRRLLQSHCAMVIEQANNRFVFSIGSFSQRKTEVELFNQLYPWNSTSIVSPNSSGNFQLVAESCLESKLDYNIRLKVQANDRPLSGLVVTTDQSWPCESAHMITISLDGIKPLTLTLPYPILPNNLKATLRRKDGIVEITAPKALQHLWPEDCVKPGQPRWDPDALELWNLNENLIFHIASQFNLDYLIIPTGNETDVLCQVRETIRSIFVNATQKGSVLFQLKLEVPNQKTVVDWYIRAHPPARISPGGAPILLLSAVDHHQTKQLTDEGKIDRRKSIEDFHRIFSSPGPKGIVTIHLYTAEEVRLLRYILQLNSTKIQPSMWQKENLPLEQPSPWLATFIRPLYRDGQLNENDVIPNILCGKCLKRSNNLKRCSACKSISYCSVECQRTDWSSHKPSCVIKKKK